MRRSAFTLIELLVVLMIMAILAGAMVPMITANRLQAQQAKVSADQDAIKTASTMVHYDCGASCWGDGAVAPGLTTGAGIMTVPILGGCTCTAPTWGGPYLDRWANDPWGNPYRMIWSGLASGSLSITTYGADNAVGGTGANADIGLQITADRLR